MKTFKKFLLESYSSDANEILDKVAIIINELGGRAEDIDYNVVDKEYFLPFEFDNTEWEVHIGRQKQRIILTNSDTGEEEIFGNEEDLRKHLKSL